MLTRLPAQPPRSLPTWAASAARDPSLPARDPSQERASPQPLPAPSSHCPPSPQELRDLLLFRPLKFYVPMGTSCDGHLVETEHSTGGAWPVLLVWASCRASREVPLGILAVATGDVSSHEGWPGPPLPARASVQDTAGPHAWQLQNSNHGGRAEAPRVKLVSWLWTAEPRSAARRGSARTVLAGRALLSWNHPTVIAESGCSLATLSCWPAAGAA